MSRSEQPNQAAQSAREAGADAERAASRLEASPVMRALGRAGHAANGVVHLALAGIAVAVATGAGAGSADQSGAMSAIASTPLGLGVLWFVAIALVALAVVSLLEGVADRARDGWGALAKGVAKAVAYGVVSGTAISSAMRGGGGGGGGSGAESLTGAVMAQPAGQILVGVLGVAIVAVGVVFVVRGVTKRFAKHISPPAEARRVAMALGTLGYAAKGVAIGVVGVLFVAAAATHDAEQAGGLDEALRSLQELPFGKVVLLAVALGLGAYGVFCIARAGWATRR